MSKFGDGQLSLTHFKQPIGMKLREENRWVQKARTIPWAEMEERYAKLFTNRKGKVTKPLRLAIGAGIILAEYGYSDEETALQIQETAYLQYFCGYAGYDDSKLPFDPSLMVYFRKRLTPEILGEINKMIIASAKEEKDTILTIGERKPRTYLKRAHRDYLALVRNRKPGAKKMHKAI